MNKGQAGLAFILILILGGVIFPLYQIQKNTRLALEELADVVAQQNEILANLKSHSDDNLHSNPALMTNDKAKTVNMNSLNNPSMNGDNPKKSHVNNPNPNLNEKADYPSLAHLLAITNAQCAKVREGELDFDDNTMELIEKKPGKMTSFAVQLQLPTAEQVEIRNKRIKDGLEEEVNIPQVNLAPRFKDFELKCYSQNTEDGILLALFWLIGTKSKKILEICSGVGWENNAANLIINFGCTGVLIDGNPSNVNRGNSFYLTHPSTKNNPPVFLKRFLTAENLNSAVFEGGLSGEIDLLSIDIDGMDYWIWDALEIVNPRVVVVEIQEIWDWSLYLTRPYRADHISYSIPEMGASINAFIYLARQRGYHLIGCIELGFNAFFIRNDVAPHLFGDEYDPKNCFSHWTPSWRAYRRKKASCFIF